MKKLLILIVVLFLGSCATRKVNKTRERISLNETGTIERSAPGDVIVFPAPRTPNERPKATTKTYRGERGATATVTYNEDGFVESGVVICPEISEKEKYDREMDYKIRTKDSERKFNVLAIKEGKGLILWMTVIISCAWVARGFFKR